MLKMLKSVFNLCEKKEMENAVRFLAYNLISRDKIRV